MRHHLNSIDYPLAQILPLRQYQSMVRPKDITHCFAFDRAQKRQKRTPEQESQRVRNPFIYGTYIALGILVFVQFFFFLFV